MLWSWRSLNRRQHSSQLQCTIRRASELVSSSAFALSWSRHSGSIICHVGAALQDAVHQLALLGQVAKPVRIGPKTRVGQHREAAREAVKCSPVLSAGSCSGSCSGSRCSPHACPQTSAARAEAALAHRALCCSNTFMWVCEGTCMHIEGHQHQTRLLTQCLALPRSASAAAPAGGGWVRHVQIHLLGMQHCTHSMVWSCWHLPR